MNTRHRRTHERTKLIHRLSPTMSSATTGVAAGFDIVYRLLKVATFHQTTFITASLSQIRNRKNCEVPSTTDEN